MAELVFALLAAGRVDERLNERHARLCQQQALPLRPLLAAPHERLLHMCRRELSALGQMVGHRDAAQHVESKIRLIR